MYTNNHTQKKMSEEEVYIHFVKSFVPGSPTLFTTSILLFNITWE